MKCFVTTCPNDSMHGKFRGYVCVPCWMYAAALYRNGHIDWKIINRSEWIGNNLYDVIVHSTLENPQCLTSKIALKS